MCLLGLDIGTSGCKALIFDIKGNIKGQGYKEYHLVSPKPGYYEIDSELIWESTKEVIKKSLQNYSGEPIKAISVSSFGEAATPIDIDGNVLNNSIIYIDKRGSEEAKYLEEKLGYEKILNITGVSPHPIYTINKIMWIKKHLPEIYKKTWKFLLFADFILFKLGSKPYTDFSLAARTMAFDIINKKWSSEILNCAGVDEDKFGQPVQAGTVIGQISKSIASELGLPVEALLVAGGHDQPCAALGAGVIHNNIAVDGIGTAECVTPAFDRPIISKEMAKSSFACVPHVKKDMYVTYAFTYTSGSLLKWYRDNFGYKYFEEAKQAGINIYELLIEKASKKPSDLFILPHFAGAATPYMDTAAKGAIIGLNINTTSEDIIKGILEGITYEMMVNMDKLKDAGVVVDELRVVGGLSKSEEFLQLKANMMGKRITTIQTSEAGILGVAILSGVACGLFENIEDGVSKLVKKKKEFYPDLKINEIYKEKFEIYKRIYPAIKGIYTKET